MKDKIIWAIVGPSGSGKTTVGAGALKELGIPEIVSHTTRNKREGEIEGVTYYYVSKEEFDKIPKVEEVKYSGNYYCTAMTEVEDKFKLSDELVIVVSLEGVHALREHYGDSVKSIFMKVNKEECINRMIARGDSEEAIENRKRNFEVIDEFNNDKHCDFVYTSTEDTVEKEIEAFKRFYQKLKEPVL